jgi:hypothetical protein
MTARADPHRWRARVWVLALLLVLTGSALEPPPTPDPQPGQLRVEARQHGALNTLWNSYGDTGGQWSGGDSTVSVQLPDGRTAWFFSDTFLGTVNDDGTRPLDAPFVHNSLVVQDGDTLTTLHGGTLLQPAPLVGSSAPLHWVGAAVVDGDKLRVLYNTYDRTGGGSLDVRMSGTAVATFALPALNLTDLRTLPFGDRIGWGSASIAGGDHTYVYGTEHVGESKFAHVARVADGDVLGAWEFWTGSGWSTDQNRSARLLSGVGSGYGVTRVGDEYVLVTQDSNVVFSPHVVAYRAPSPTGPFTAQTWLYTAPEASRDRIVYDTRVHPSISTDRNLVISYNVNSLDPDAAYVDARVYRPRFVEISWPPRLSSAPPAPTRLTVTPEDDAVILRWRGSDPRASYWIYRRDVTAGQTHFGKLGEPRHGTATTITRLLDGHTYEFAVSAYLPAGESTPSRAVLTTAG